MSARWILTVGLLSAATLGCPGDGSRIPAEMMGGGTMLASLQTDIFTPFCSPCHQPGGIGPMPLDSEAATFANLVEVDSIEIPSLKRVLRFNSELSYVVWKIEGRQGIVGDPMPLGGPMLSQDRIDAIRDWIDSGAPP